MSSIEISTLLISSEILVKISEWDPYCQNKWLLKDFKVKMGYLSQNLLTV